VARSGAEAIDLIREGGENGFALMLIEYTLPEMGGLEVVKFAKENSQKDAEKPFIVICEPEDTIIMEDNSTHVISFPYDIEQLKAVCIKSDIIIF